MLIDVRSPCEFAKGHIPGAKNLPLFSDHERAEVGTLYKHLGQQKAFDLGLQFVGPKLANFVIEGRAYNDQIELYCSRGGMRSHSMQWLFKSAGMECSVKKGGYKTFRRWVLETLAAPRTFKVLTGLTGSGKTQRLHELEKMGEAMLDLEGAANHRGSSFGMLGLPGQPTNEHFENLLATRLSKLSGPIWIEDESKMIGTCKVPDPLFAAMQKSQKIVIEAPKEKRIAQLIALYAHYPKKDLIEAVTRLQKKLGRERTKEVILAINQDDFFNAVQFILEYYDKAYDRTFSRQRRN